VVPVPLYLFPFLPYLSLRLEVDPLNQLGGPGSAVNSLSGVLGRATAEIEFGAL